jgi:hypothetical protein
MWEQGADPSDVEAFRREVGDIDRLIGPATDSERAFQKKVLGGPLDEYEEGIFTGKGVYSPDENVVMPPPQSTEDIDGPRNQTADDYLREQDQLRYIESGAEAEDFFLNQGDEFDDFLNSLTREGDNPFPYLDEGQLMNKRPDMFPPYTQGDLPGKSFLDDLRGFTSHTLNALEPIGMASGMAEAMGAPMTEVPGYAGFIQQAREATNPFDPKLIEGLKSEKFTDRLAPAAQLAGKFIGRTGINLLSGIIPPKVPDITPKRDNTQKDYWNRIRQDETFRRNIQDASSADRAMLNSARYASNPNTRATYVNRALNDLKGAKRKISRPKTTGLQEF